MLKSALSCIIKISYGNPEIQTRFYDRVSSSEKDAESFANSVKNIFQQLLQ